MKPLTFYALFFLLFACASPSPQEKKANLHHLQLGAGSVERIVAFENQYVSPRNIDVWLPESYSSDNKYAVLYMHDGQMLFDSTSTWNKQEWKVDEIVNGLIQTKAIRECIVVGIWNGGPNRRADYFPQIPFESLSDSIQDEIYGVERHGQSLMAIKVNSDNYLKFIVNELKPIIDRRYSTLKESENTFIAGSSMGGLISMYAICEYPETFGGAACLSTHWPGVEEIEGAIIPEAFANYLKEHLPSPSKHRIYFDYGTETLDALYAPWQSQIDTIFFNSAYSEENWQSKKFPGADHSERA
ncbi:MAG: alpha/beta hydrolase-fold protein [Bacteroidota bacterium]